MFVIEINFLSTNDKTWHFNTNDKSIVFEIIGPLDELKCIIDKINVNNLATTSIISHIITIENKIGKEVIETNDIEIESVRITDHDGVIHDMFPVILMDCNKHIRKYFISINAILDQIISIFL